MHALCSRDSLLAGEQSARRADAPILLPLPDIHTERLLLNPSSAPEIRLVTRNTLRAI